MNPGPCQRWTLLTDHARILTCISVDPDIRLRGLAKRVGITERVASRTVTDAGGSGFLSHERVGTRNRCRVETARRSDHAWQRHLGAAEPMYLAADADAS